MPSRPSAGAVDTRRDASVPSAPPDLVDEGGEPAVRRSEPGAPDRSIDPPTARVRRRRPRLIVEGARAAVADRDGPGSRRQLGGVPEYPVQVSKVQAPPLRDETLARERLLEWLAVKIHRRAVLLIAEAGYGKTTLLADFSRRTRIRVLWFRLDRGDRDWVGFLAYLVAAVRVHAPDFGASTSSLLRETATSAPSLDTVLDTFLRELGGMPNDASALVFDDFHLVDDSPDVRHIIRELLARGPERMSFVFASRREPPIRLARLRALGEVAELGTDELRFDDSETERLFRETYEMRLEPSVLAELSRRTEGWAASLQLVRSALHDRNAAQVRSFISSLSGAEGHLYEYLAEEVVGDLPDDLQDFLMRTSLLETVDLALGPVAAGVSEDQARAFIEDGERHGLFGRGGPHTRHVARAHPLVRDFLQARLVRALGEADVRLLHIQVAQAAEAIDWQIASRHYLLSGRDDEAIRVLTSSIENILATGAYDAAQERAAALRSGVLPGAAGLVLLSRLAQQRAAAAEALDFAEQAWALEPRQPAVLVNLMTARTLGGDVQGSLDASALLERAGERDRADLGRVHRLTLETSLDGSLELVVRELESLAASLRSRQEHHFLGVALLNLAYTRLALGDPDGCLANAEESVTLLSSTSAGNELVSARLARAWALAWKGDMASSRSEIENSIQQASPGQALELAIEVGHIEASLGDVGRAKTLIEAVAPQIVATTDLGEQALVVRALIEIRQSDIAGALRDVGDLRHGYPRSAVAFEARRFLSAAFVSLTAGRPDAEELARLGSRQAISQGARLWSWFGRTLEALARPSVNPSQTILSAAQECRPVLSMAAEAVLLRIGELDPLAYAEVEREAEQRPERWRAATRPLLDSNVAADRRAAATLLERIGERDDIHRLKGASRRLHGTNGQRHGHNLARRLAAHVFIEDLGRVRIYVGARSIDGGDVRRKVLGLLCLLLTKPRFASTREEVVDSLWPDNDPTSALNSLNQTVYFLRRLFEEDYREDTSPGYVGQDGETIWLDQELVDCRSRRCLEIIRGMPGDPTPDGSVLLSNEYHGRFALDFAYEEWSVAYRDALHAAYLRVVEHAIRKDLDAGHFARGTYLAERASEVDPDAEEIQVALVRLYRVSGAHAAAAEQYSHYAKSLAELGVDPPPFADI